MRLLVCFTLGMAVATAAAQLQPAEVQYIGAEKPLRGYRLGDECFVPIELLPSIGWDATLRSDKVTLTVAGRKVDFPHRTFAGSQSIPFRKAMAEFGGETEWDRIGRVLKAVAIGKFAGGQIKFALPVSSVTLDAGKILEIRGAKIIASPAQVPKGIKLQQGPDGVRITSSQYSWDIPNGPEQYSFSLPAAPLTNPLPVADTSQSPVGTPPPVSTEPTQIPPVEPPVDLSGDIPLDLVVQTDNATSSIIQLRTVVPLTSAPQLRMIEPNVFELVLPNVAISISNPEAAKASGVTNVSVTKEGASSVIRFILDRPMGYEIWTDASGVSIQLIKPAIGNGKLAGKLIVVDPGHGGKDGGAKSGIAREKELTLKVSLALAEQLKAAGATVIMTRRTDVFIGLTERAEVANRNKADFFISVHINSTAKASTSGSITFFHGPSAVKELLARCLQQQLAKINGLPSIGVWSDKRIYNSGFAVLRMSKMPGVLLELGFINHPNDRARMLQADFPASVAGAVVKGLKVYLGDGK